MRTREDSALRILVLCASVAFAWILAPFGRRSALGCRLRDRLRPIEQPPGATSAGQAGARCPRHRALHRRHTDPAIEHSRRDPLILYGVVVIGLVDNVVRPLVVGKDARMPDYVVLLSTLGGISLFGVNGFIIGPLIAATFITAWDTFESDVGKG